MRNFADMGMVGTGVSGGEEGAMKGPSIMPADPGRHGNT